MDSPPPPAPLSQPSPQPSPRRTAADGEAEQGLSPVPVPTPGGTVYSWDATLVDVIDEVVASPDGQVTHAGSFGGVNVPDNGAATAQPHEVDEPNSGAAASESLLGADAANSGAANAPPVASQCDDAEDGMFSRAASSLVLPAMPHAPVTAARASPHTQAPGGTATSAASSPTARELAPAASPPRPPPLQTAVGWRTPGDGGHPQRSGNTAASWHKAAAKAQQLADDQAADAAALYNRCRRMTAMLTDLSAAAEQMAMSETTLLRLQEENAELASSLVQAQERHRSAAAEAKEALSRANSQQQRADVATSQLSDISGQLTASQAQVERLSAMLHDVQRQHGELRARHAEAVRAIATLTGASDPVSPSETLLETGSDDEAGGAGDDTDSPEHSSERSTLRASITADQVAESLETMGVRSLAEAASFGSLPALMSKSQTAQEALTNACRRAVGLSEQLSEAQDLIEAKNSELDAVEQRLRASKDHADKLEAALEDAMDQALRWKETAEQLSVDLHNAGHIIGDLSSELEARAHLREQLDSAMNRIKAVAIKLDGRGVEFITHTMKKLQCSTNPDKEHHFKAAHSMIKRVVVDILGERPPGASWRIGDEHKFLHSIPPHLYSNCYKRLQELVIAYDNMSEQTKNHMTTAREVVANARTLLAIGKFVKKKLATGGASDSPRRRGAPRRTSTGRGSRPKWVAGAPPRSTLEFVDAGPAVRRAVASSSSRKSSSPATPRSNGTAK